MLFDTNKNKGRAGLAIAIEYFATNGYTVSIPLNDTQDYDLIVDNGKIYRISVKATGQKRQNGNYILDLRNTGGTNGNVYGRECEKNIDYIFVVNEKKEKWLLPKNSLNYSSVTLGEKYEKYRIE